MSTVRQARFKRTLSLLGLILAISGPAFAQAPAEAQRDKPDLKVEHEEPRPEPNCTPFSFSSGPLYRTRSDITVKVTHDGTPMPGVLVVVKKREPGSATEPSVGTGKTDLQGVAKFFSMPSGTYTVRVGELLAQSVAINVDPNSDGSNDIVLEWPSAHLPVRNLRGMLLSADTKKPFANVLVELLDVRSSYLLASTRTDAIGYYQLTAATRYPLSVPGDGIYVLRFTPAGSKWGGHDVGVWVSDKGAEQVSVLSLIDDCGGFVFVVDNAENRRLLSNITR